MHLSPTSKLGYLSFKWISKFSDYSVPLHTHAPYINKAQNMMKDGNGLIIETFMDNFWRIKIIKALTLYI